MDARKLANCYVIPQRILQTESRTNNRVQQHQGDACVSAQRPEAHEWDLADGLMSALSVPVPPGSPTAAAHMAMLQQLQLDAAQMLTSSSSPDIALRAMRFLTGCSPPTEHTGQLKCCISCLSCLQCTGFQAAHLPTGTLFTVLQGWLHGVEQLRMIAWRSSCRKVVQLCLHLAGKQAQGYGQTVRLQQPSSGVRCVLSPRLCRGPWNRPLQVSLSQIILEVL